MPSANYIHLSYLAFLITIFLVTQHGAARNFSVSNVFGSNMVLQCEPNLIHIWGYGTPDVEVILRIEKQVFSVLVQDDERWEIELHPQPPGGPHLLNLTHASSDEILLANVMFGDVWVCSGQSNMAFAMKNIFNTSEEIEKALSYQNIRLMQVARKFADEELQELPGISIAWTNPTPGSVPNFSALCLLYGERLSDLMGEKPIGLIDTTWGGTPIEAWSPVQVLQECNTPPSQETNHKGNNKLWNAMVHPLTAMSAYGAIWYQGEYNVRYNSELYSCHFKNMIRTWKESFYKGISNVRVEEWKFPFGFVQIGPTNNNNSDAWGRLRWHQTVDTGFAPNPDLPHTFMAAAYDLTDLDSPSGQIHPRDKQTVATRLANSAKNFLYNETHLTSGPRVINITKSISTGILMVTYDMDVKLQSFDGFVYRELSGEWKKAHDIRQTSEPRVFEVLVDPAATQLAYGWLPTVCQYKATSIYSLWEELPAEVGLWDITV